MHQTLFAATTLVALLAAAPANAQMCGPGQQPQASGQQAGGMMCGMMGRQAADDPMADKPPQQPQQQSSMCPCCRNMSMMGGQHGQHHQMPGMQQQ